MNRNSHQSPLPRAAVIALSVMAVAVALFFGLLALSSGSGESNVAATAASDDLEEASETTTTEDSMTIAPAQVEGELVSDGPVEDVSVETSAVDGADLSDESDSETAVEDDEDSSGSEQSAETTTTTAAGAAAEPAADPGTESAAAAAPTTTSAPAQPASNQVNFTPITGIDGTSPSSSWARPDLFQTSADPVYGYDVTRVTSADGTRFNRNTYSRRQAENADGTAFFTYHGDASYNVYQLSNGTLISSTDIHPDGEPQWHPTNPNLIRHVSGNNVSTGSLQLLETNVANGRTAVIADLTSRVTSLFPGAVYMADRAEGSPSANGNRYGWIVFNDDENPIGIISYDLATDQIGGSVPVDPGVEYRLDWVSASPTGNFIMAGYWEETLAYNFDMTNEQVVFVGAEHSDIAIGPNGNDTYVYIDFTASENGGYVVAVDLVTGQTSRYFDLYDGTNTSIHFSGKAYDRPGWIVVSTYNCKVDNGWACEKVFALNLADGTIVNLAHTYNCGADYWTETHAVTNRDLTRVYFNSDGGSCGTNAEVYRIDVPNLS